MNTKLTVIVDNIPFGDIQGEWGLSILVEYGNKKILVDAGAFAIGKYFAIGDHAQGMIAIGDTKAAGSVYEQLGSLTTENRAAVKEALDTVVPTYLAWAKELVKTFL